MTFLTAFSLMAGTAVAADYQRGLNAEKRGDYDTAIREWTPLAESGDADVQYNLGVIYSRGKGFPQDFRTAFMWFNRAAQQGHTGAQFTVGLMYSKGLGVAQDQRAAIQWYTRAAENGHAGAQFNLGAVYALGKGTAKDYIRAHKWWSIARSQGFRGGDKAVRTLEKNMTRGQIARAQRMASEWKRSR